MSALVRLEKVVKTFKADDSVQIAVDNVSLEVKRGEILGIIGYSGAGKSTLVRLINALESPTSGQVFVDGRELTALSERELRSVRSGIGMIFQQFNLFRSRTVAGNVAYPLEIAGVPKTARDSRVAELLDFVGLLPLAHQYPEQLSGGQKQRVGIARALATKPKLVLADEATSALDPETTLEVLALLKRVNRELGVTVVLITHEMDAVRQIADRVAVMDSGRIVEVGTVFDVFSKPKTETAARFVGTVLHDRPRGETLERLLERHPKGILTVDVTEIAGFSSVLDSIARKNRLTLDLVYGGIGELRERRIGSLSFAVEGEESAIKSTLSELARRGIRAEFKKPKLTRQRSTEAVGSK